MGLKQIIQGPEDERPESDVAFDRIDATAREPKKVSSKTGRDCIKKICEVDPLRSSSETPRYLDVRAVEDG